MANIYREQQRALQHLRRIIEKLPREGINRKMLVMEMLTSYAVSEGIIQKYLEMSIETGVVMDRDGTLATPKKTKAAT